MEKSPKRCKLESPSLHSISSILNTEDELDQKYLVVKTKNPSIHIGEEYQADIPTLSLQANGESVQVKDSTEKNTKHSKDTEAKDTQHSKDTTEIISKNGEEELLNKKDNKDGAEEKTNNV